MFHLILNSLELLFQFLKRFKNYKNGFIKNRFKKTKPVSKIKNQFQKMKTSFDFLNGFQKIQMKTIFYFYNRFQKVETRLKNHPGKEKLRN